MVAKVVLTNEEVLHFYDVVFVGKILEYITINEFDGTVIRILYNEIKYIKLI